MREIDSHNPFAYLGVEPYATPDFRKETRDPTSADRKNMYVGQFWLNTSNNNSLSTGVSSQAKVVCLI